jgi:hypothetical protein
MSDSKNPFEGAPVHHMQFLGIRDGGGPKNANSVAALHGITVEQLKANCRQAAEEIREVNGSLQPYEQSVLDWASS